MSFLSQLFKTQTVTTVKVSIATIKKRRVWPLKSTKSIPLYSLSLV